MVIGNKLPQIGTVHLEPSYGTVCETYVCTAETIVDPDSEDTVLAMPTTSPGFLRRAAPYGVLRIIFVIVSAKRPEPAPQADRCPRSACAVFEMSQVHVQPVGIVVECQIVPGTTLYRAQQHRPPAVVC